MRIGFDGKRAVSNMTGLGNYSRLVIEEVGKRFRHIRNLANEEDSPAESVNSQCEFGMYTSTPKMPVKDWQILVYTPKMRHNNRLEPLRRLDNVEFRFPGPAGFKGSLWRTFGITNCLAADHCDIYHGLSNELPLNICGSGVKSVVTIHDLIYRRLPYCYSLPDRLIYDYKYGRSCQNADKIIAVSERTKSDIIEFYGIDPGKIEVVYQGCDDIFRDNYSNSDIRDVVERLSLPDNYLVQVGTIERRKNLELSLRALPAIDPEVKLVVVGRDHHGYKKEMLRLADELRLDDRIVWLEGVDFRDLPIVYSQARAALYPSRYEGFGIPVIEAIESGTPVIAATGSCLEEAGGEGALYVDPDSPRQMIEAINTLMGNEQLRAERVELGRRHVRKFDNSKMADSLIEIYRSLYYSQKTEPFVCGKNNH
ncbi:MAG: glycosyltransferase family 4 protein [Muribaculaceae bacterium]|nr:glycosyltransferase family 4 protein [Muribaculaceae bacterium]